jgi:hypothetical protein
MRRLIMLVLLCSMVALTGCGGGNEGPGGLNGAVTVEGTQAASDFSSTVSFTISYTHPVKDDLIGVPINYTVTLDGVIIDQVATNFNNSGIFTVSYDIPKTAFERRVRCVANSANLVSSVSVKVEPLDQLDVTPATVEFAAEDPIGTTKTFTIAGGSGNYTVESASESNVSASLSGKTVIATRESDNVDATVTITVTDTVTLQSVAVQATLIKAPVAP